MAEEEDKYLWTTAIHAWREAGPHGYQGQTYSTTFRHEQEAVEAVEGEIEFLKKEYVQPGSNKWRFSAAELHRFEIADLPLLDLVVVALNRTSFRKDNTYKIARSWIGQDEDYEEKEAK